jgi:hypothetical protein
LSCTELFCIFIINFTSISSSAQTPYMACSLHKYRPNHSVTVEILHQVSSIDRQECLWYFADYLAIQDC